ncbi:MAG: tyrosine-type recombinase/integrase [Tateyamaria sp.]|nr:tyrosine-type recombinase/integrase [Tateyamaria sp.]
MGTKQLTELAIRNLKNTGARYKITDGRGDGLLIEVMASGSKFFRIRRIKDGKEHTTTLGKYPELSLADARRMAYQAKMGGGTKRDTASQITFQQACDEYYDAKLSMKSFRTQNRFHNRMAKDVLPTLSTTPMADITSGDVLKAIQPLLDRKAIPSAIRTCGMISSILAFGIARGYCATNYASLLKPGLPVAPKVQHLDAYTTAKALKPFLVALGTSDISLYGKTFLWMSLMTASRPGEIRAASWSDISFEQSKWEFRVPKTGLMQRNPLPQQLVMLLQVLHEVTGHKDFLFASGGKSGHLSDASPMLFVRQISKEAKIEPCTAHGFRSTFRSLAVTEINADPHVCEAQLSHSSMASSGLGRAYARADYYDKRRILMQQWADYIYSL